MLFTILLHPNQLFRELARPGSPAVRRVLRLSLLLVLLPPAFAYLGAGWFGWRAGAAEPLYLEAAQRAMVSVCYLLAIAFGLVSTALIGRWMAVTYGARPALPLHFALYTVVSLPLALASVVHLYPDVFLNVLVLIPALIWSMVLLYRGLPVVLGTGPERGMLMSSALVGWLLVAAVSLLGLTAGLWTLGLGPALRV